MTVIIAHGQPKSGSTFLFSAAVQLRDIVDGDNYHAALREVMGGRADAFQPKLEGDFVRDFHKRCGGRTLVLKTHGPLTPDVRSLIEDGTVKAFTSFRDPRDACKSMLDAGETDRAKGSDRWFSTLRRVDEVAKPVARQFEALRTWLSCPKVLAMPYYLIANNQDYAVRTLCRHLGFGALGGTVAALMQSNKTSVPEFFKGVSDRFLTDLTPDEIKYLNTALANSIADYRSIVASSMAEHGHRMLYYRLAALRKDALKNLGFTE